LTVIAAPSGGTRVWLNDGSANFRQAQSINTSGAQDAVVGDFDGDGDVDVAIVDAATIPETRIWWNDGSGIFSSGPVISTVKGLAIGAADIDGDGGVLRADAVHILDVLANDDDIDRDDDNTTLKVVAATAASGATVTFSGLAGAGISYDPSTTAAFAALAEGETTTDIVTYTIEDSHGATSTAQAEVIVTGANDAPVMTPEIFVTTLTEDTERVGIALPIYFELNDRATDIDSDDDASTLTYTFSNGSAKGTFVEDMFPTIFDQDLQFLPGTDFQHLAAGEFEDATIDVVATDSHGASSNVATLTFRVTGANDDPTLAAGIAAAVEDGPTVNVDLAALGSDVDSDDDGTTLTYGIIAQPSEGSASISGTTLTFDPGADFQDLALGDTRDVVIQVQAIDAHSAVSNIADVTVTVIGTNDQPEANPESYTVNEDQTLTVSASNGVLVNDTDPDGDTLNAFLTGFPNHGVVVLNPDGSFTYTPDQNYAGNDSFIYTADDGSRGDAEIVRITVNPVNDDPTALDDTAAADENGTAVLIDVLANDDDIDSDDDNTTLRVIAASAASGATVSFTGVAGAGISYDPDTTTAFEFLAAGETATDTITYTIEDSHGATATAVVAVTVTGASDGPPIADAPAVALSLLTETTPAPGWESGGLKVASLVDVGLSENHLAVLTGGNIVVSSYDVVRTETEVTEEHFITVLDQDGTVLAVTPYILDTFNGTSSPALQLDAQHNPASVIALSDGGFAAVWNVEIFSPATVSPDARQVRIQFFDETGTPVTIELVAFGDGARIDPFNSQSLFFTDTAALDNGNVVIAMQGRQLVTGPFSNSFDTKIVVVDPDVVDPDVVEPRGHVVATFFLEQGAPSTSQLRVTATSNGGFVATWNETVTFPTSTAYIQWFEPGGESLGPRQALGTNLNGNYDVIQLADGDIAIARPGGNAGMSLEIVSFSGETILPVTVIAPGDPDFISNPSLTALADGTFMMAWKAFDNGDQVIYTQRFAADGARIGDKFEVDRRTTTINSTTEAEIDVAPDGTVTVFWQELIQTEFTTERDYFVRNLDVPLLPREDTPFDLQLDVALVDTDGSESITALTLTGLPDGFIVSDGVNAAASNGVDPLDIALFDLSNPLVVTPAAEYSGSFTVEVSATSTETLGGDSATTTQSLTITVSGANDAPTLAPGTAAAVEDGPVVDIDLAALGDDIDSDDDGTTLTYTIVGDPVEGTASITGTTLGFDPGADFQVLSPGETRDVVVRVRATDSHGASAETDVTVTVTGTADGIVVLSLFSTFTGQELYLSDGTAAGTVLLKDILPGAGSSVPFEITVFGDKVLFRANDEINGSELWVTDGTAAGTVLLKDILPGAGSSVPIEITVFGDKVLFQANDGINGSELWITDGTTAGTVLLKDIQQGSGSSSPTEFTVFGDKVLFRAFDEINGSELWVTDGTAAGTVLLKDILPGLGSSFPFEFTVFGDKVLFQARDGLGQTQLWVTDGTAEGTVVTDLTDLNPGGASSSPQEFTVFGDKMLLRANDGVNGSELWITDGTTAGTILLKDILPGSGSSSPFEFTVLSDKVLFRANDGINGQELWITDGTAAGTVLLKDIQPGVGSSSPFEFTVLGDKVLFRAFGINGTELWITDGTAAGTALLKDIFPGFSSVPTDFTVFGDKVLFQANDGINGRELWITDGTTAGTVLLKDISPGSSFSSSHPMDFTVLGDKVLFQANDAINSFELWVTDGTTAGTVLLKDIQPGSGASRPIDFTVLGDKVLFRADDGINGQELWITDGTTAGTVLLKDIFPGFSHNSSSPQGFTVLGDKVLFRANDGINGQELWITDGTTAGTVLLKDIAPGGSSSSPQDFTVFGDKVLFQAQDRINGFELWITDGTTAGTVLLKDILPGGGSSSPQDFTVLGDKAYFRANDGINGQEFWVTDGTAAGTTLVSNINELGGAPNPTNLTLFDPGAPVTGTVLNDLLNGTTAAESIDGLEGDDVITGFQGDDLLQGGPGADSFVFRAGDGNDTIWDFMVGVDALVLDGVTIASSVEADGNGDGADDTVLTLSSGDTIILDLVTGVTDTNDLLG
jgi:ELWxxDGT repeat protein/VCBS repeat-containing protein